MKHCTAGKSQLVFVCALILSVLFTSGAYAQERRELVVALYPFIPAKAELYWRLQGDFERRYPDVRLRFVDAPEYYSGQLEELLAKGQVDVAEVDTVFLHDFKSKNLITPFAGATLGEFLGVARSAATIDGIVWGIPHWVCGNFLFFRKDDPENGGFVKATTLDALEGIIGRAADYRQGLLTDLKGSSSLGEKYLDAVVDRYQTPEKALQHAHPDTIEQTAVTSLARLFRMCPGGLCDSVKHHDYSGYYARQFAHRNARALIGYSERMYFVVDEFLNGVREDEPGIGRIAFDEYGAVGTDDVDAIGAPLDDSNSRMLAWVDVLTIRAGMDDRRKRDAEAFVAFVASEEFNTAALLPEWGTAPRYLLPARATLYTSPKLLRAAPLYSKFRQIMESAVTVTGPKLNENLREIGKKIDQQVFPLSNVRRG